MCYDHLAGRLGVALCDMLQRRGYVVLTDGGGEVTASGARFLAGLGVALPEARRTKRHYCRGCIDWTERRHHLSGAVGAALAAAFLDRGWIARVPDSRVLTVTARGKEKLAELRVANYAVAPAPPRLRVVAGRA